MYGAKDLTGQRFGRLVAIKVDHTENNKRYWLCKCDCGNETVVAVTQLTSGHTKSCSCLRSEMLSDRSRKHGLSNTRLFSIWCGMKSRCYNKNQRSYKNYGAKGVVICDEWHDFKKFYDWAIENGWDESNKELSIDRKNVNGIYEPCNCRFITSKQQANNKTNNRLITYNGETHTLAEWAEIVGLDYSALLWRIDNGFDIETSLTTPSGQLNIHYLTYNGETKSAKEWSEQFGISETLIIRRSQEGWSDEDAITTPWNCKTRNPKPYDEHTKFLTFNGETKSASEFARQYGMSIQLLSYRLKNGWTVEEALTKSPHKYNRKDAK